MRLSLFDLHCDTATGILRHGEALTSNTLAVSLDKAVAFERYTQVMAVFTPRAFSDEDGWQHLLATVNYLKADPAVVTGSAVLERGVPAPEPCKASLILGIEDARVLCGDISRVDELARMGFRIFTPLWGGKTCLGGSHDTNEGLTEFGRAATRRAIRSGMIPDISHASVRSAEEIFAIAEETASPVIASHSDLSSVCPVSRNLADGQVKKILASGGIIGVNLHSPFLCQNRAAAVDDVLRHMDGFLSLGAAEALALGCDMDGADLPRDLSDLSALPRLAEAMLASNYPEELVRAVFFENAQRFAEKHFSPICFH